jgi:Cu(I)/Ag(I) efflux system periplasmic protein CusF
MRNNRRFISRLVTLAAALLVVLPVAAQNPQGLVDGEVRKVDKDQGKLTLKHAEIKALDMPAMTMVFTVKDRALLDSVKAGDKVRFKAVQEAGRFVVTEIQATN